MERLRVEAAFQATVTENPIDPQTFSSWRRLIRVTARIRWLAEKIRLRKHEQDGEEGPLDQGRTEKSSPLSPFIDDKGIIRVGGRVDEVIVSYDQKHPALLLNEHNISLLITRHMHKYGHTGVATTTAKTRRKYWILKANKLSRSVRFKCVFCREMAHKAETQLMADLAHLRLAPQTPPFYYTACDYFGPNNVKIGVNKSMKHYGVIFTCLNTKAFHLEMAVDLSTMEFMQVLRTFFALRGYPAVILSDNGSQMVGTERELREMIESLDNDELRESCCGKGIQWIFTTPAAPHQNGCTESLV